MEYRAIKKALLIAITSVVVSLHAFADDRVLAIQADDIAKADADLGAAIDARKSTNNFGVKVSAEAKKLKDTKAANRKKNNRSVSGKRK